MPAREALRGKKQHQAVSAKLLADGFTRYTSGYTNSSWTSIESSTYICSSPCSEAQLVLAQLRAADFQAHAQQKSATRRSAVLHGTGASYYYRKH